MSPNTNLYTDLLSSLITLDKLHRTRLSSYGKLPDITDVQERERTMEFIYELDYQIDVLRFKVQQQASDIGPLQLMKRFNEVDSAYLKFVLAHFEAEKAKHVEADDKEMITVIDEDFVGPLNDLIRRTCV